MTHTQTITGNEASYTSDGFTFVEQDTDIVWFVRHTDVISREDVQIAGKERETITVKNAKVFAPSRY